MCDAVFGDDRKNTIVDSATFPDKVVQLYSDLSRQPIRYNYIIKYSSFRFYYTDFSTSLRYSTGMYDSHLVKASHSIPVMHKGNVLMESDMIYPKYVEKYVDTSLVADMLFAAFKDRFDVAILITNDTDFSPCINILQELYGKKVILLTFKGGNKNLRAICYGHMYLENLK